MTPSQSVPFTEEPSTSRRNRIVWIALATIAVVVACVSFSFSETVRPAKTTFYKPAVKTSLEFNMICILVCNSYIVASQARQLLNGTSRRGGSCRTPTQWISRSQIGWYYIFLWKCLHRPKAFCSNLRRMSWGLFHSHHDTWNSLLWIHLFVEKQAVWTAIGCCIWWKSTRNCDTWADRP